jgi:serine protease Do
MWNVISMKTLLFGLLLFSTALPAVYAQNAPAAPATPTPPNLASPQGKVTPPAGPIDIANEPIVRVVANVEPAVVNITAEGTVPRYYSGTDEFFRHFRGFRDAREQSIGSGLLISPDGYILTNAHVVALAEAEKLVHVTLDSGSKYEAQIVEADDDKDMALLKIEDKTMQFPYFDLSYVSPNHLGETVVALGSPAGYQRSVSHGILSAKDRTFTVDDRTYNNLIQTDAAINPGNSGGPLVDLNGGLVGINSAKLAGEAIENIGFAIPSEVVVPWANDAMAVARGQKPAASLASLPTGEALRQHLGMTLKTLTAAKAADLGLEMNGGLVITDVEPGGPADQAGLRKDMVVVALGNREVTDLKTLPSELLQLQSGSNVSVHVIFVQSMGFVTITRGGTVLLTAR